MQTDTSRHSIAPESSATSVSTDALITLLSDDHAREISTAIVDEAKTAREIVSECDGSRTTVYRRLNRLEDAGLVRSELRIDPDGNHCKEFFLVRDCLEVTLESGTITVAARQSNRP